MRHFSSLLILVPALACLPTFAAASWHPDGNHITYAPGYEFLNNLVSDHSGGGIMLWSDPYQGSVRAQRVSGAGIVQWPIDGMIMMPPNGGNGLTATSDGAGGIFVVWETSGPGPGFEPTLRMQHFDGSGAPLWAPGGVFIANIYNYALTVLLEDQAGGVIAIFQDLRPGQNNQLYGQRVDAAGATLWGTDGVPLVVLPVGQSWQVMQVWHSIASDGAGGVVAAWEDVRNQTTHDIYAQRLSASGQRLWGDEAVLLHPTPGAQRDPSLATDGAGGAFIAWNDTRNGSSGDVYAQHVDATGAIQWGSEGLAVGLQWPSEWYANVTSDGTGGIFVVWNDMRNATYDKYVQHYNAAGEAQWTPGGVAPSNLLGDRGIFAVIPDAQGGALLGFTQWGEIRAQKLSPAGAREWGDNGVTIAQGGSARGISDGAGGMIMAWNRGVGEENVDIFAQRITASGSVPTAVETPARSSLFVRDVYPNPFAGATTLEIEMAAPSSIRVAVFDVAGRRVRNMLLPASTSSQRVEFDGRDDSGKLLVSGVYFCRVEAPGETVTRKVVITR